MYSIIQADMISWFRRTAFSGGIMNTIVCKFGGTSLADAEQFKKIKKIIESSPDRRFVVASAPGKRFPEDIKVTDMLLACYEHAAEGRDTDAEFSAIAARFQSIIDDLQLGFPLQEEMDIIREHLKNDPQREYMASRGEYLNSRILAEYLGYTFVDPEWCVVFHDSGELDEQTTNRTLAAALRPLPCAVVAGFYGADYSGRIRTFSRGGSDVTGSLVSRAIEADLYENWTDVSGLLAADPRIVDHPKTAKYLSYRELRTLSYMGASVLHSDAVQPVTGLGIPINIRNTNRPKDPGTMIVRKLPKDVTKYPVVGVAGQTGMSVIQIEKVMVSDDSGFTAVILDLLKEHQLPFEHCLTGIDSVTLIFRSSILEPYKDLLFEEINTALHPDFLGLKEHLSTIAVLGEKSTEASDANILVLNSLAQAGIELSTINQGAGKLNLLISVPEERYEDAIRTIYHAIEDML